MIHIKPGVRLHGVRVEMMFLTRIVECVVERVCGMAVRITCGIEGGHSFASLHYAGSALDYGSKEFTKEQKAEILKIVRESAGDDFDFILESEGQPNEHFHGEFQPKSRYA